MSVLVSGHAGSHHGGLLSSAAASLSRAAASVAREWRVHRDLRTLGELSDGALADIGIGRGFEERAVRHGRGRHAARPARPIAEPLMPPSWTEWR